MPDLEEMAPDFEDALEIMRDLSAESARQKQGLPPLIDPQELERLCLIAVGWFLVNSAGRDPRAQIQSLGLDRYVPKT